MATDPIARASLPDDALFLAGGFPRAGRAGHPDLCSTGRIWLGNHQHFRTALARLDDMLGTLDPFSLDTQRIARDLGSNLQSLLGGLSGHHGVEDAHYFPAFRAAEPRLGPGIDILDNDHHFIHDAMDRLFGSTQRILAEFGGSVPTPGPVRGHLRDDFRSELQRFTAAINRHLDDEEDLVIPFLLHRNGAVPLAA